MAGQMTLQLRADPTGFTDGINDAIRAIRDWENVADHSADNASGKLEEAMLAVVDLGRATDKSADEMKRALEGLGIPAEDAERAFDAIQQEAKNAGRVIPRSFDDAADAVEGVTDSLDDVGDSASTAGDDVSKIGDGTKDVGDKLHSLGDIAKDVLEGDIGGAIGTAGELFGGLASIIGGGAVGGAIGTAIGGVVTSWVTQWQEGLKESEERASEWAQAYIEAGDRVLTAAITAGNALEIISDPDKFKEASTRAEAWGIDVATAIAAQSGETWALEAAQESLNDRLDDYRAKAKEEGFEIEGLQALPQDLAIGIKALEQLGGEMETGRQKADIYSQYLTNLAENTAGASVKIDEFGDSVYSLPDGTSVYVDAETGQATTDLEKIEQRAYGLPDGNIAVNAAILAAMQALDKVDNRNIPDKNSTVHMGVDDSAVTNWQPPTKFMTVQTLLRQGRLNLGP